MDYRHLNLVAEICRHGSFGRAAQALGISQPALSKNIARLEDQLAVKLFARGKGSTQPTIFALHIVARSKQMLGDAQRIAIEVRQMATDETGKVRIGAESISRVGFLTPVISEIVRRFPKLQIEIVDRPDAEIAVSLLAREIDIGIARSDEAVESDDLVEFELFSSPVIAVVRPHHPVLAKGGASALSDYPVVLLNTPTSLEAAPPPKPGMGIIVGPTDMVKDVVGRTDAVTRGPAFLFAAEITRGSLGWLPLRPAHAYSCSMITTTGAMHSAVFREIVRIAQNNGKAVERAQAALTNARSGRKDRRTRR
jgi:DNA-binding transcriptional LysR family regulator